VQQRLLQRRQRGELLLVDVLGLAITGDDSKHRSFFDGKRPMARGEFFVPCPSSISGGVGLLVGCPEEI